jgi:hypothetical protein
MPRAIYPILYNMQPKRDLFVGGGVIPSPDLEPYGYDCNEYCQYQQSLKIFDDCYEVHSTT